MGGGSFLDGDSPIAALALQELRMANLRNAAQLVFQPSRRLNVITGNNGQGKTSVLEAIYLLATSKSFRTGRLGELVKHGESVGSVAGTFSERREGQDLARSQSVGIEHGRRTVRIDGEAPPSLAHYATRSPVVVFDPQQMSLSTGAASERRTLLDRVTLFTNPDVAVDRSRYSRALRERQHLLSRGRVAAPELEPFEVLLARHGAAITAARRAASADLTAEVIAMFGQIAAPNLALTASYMAGGSDDVAEAQQRLRDDRFADAQRKRTGFGPHRDDLDLTVDGHAARIVASQGQHRAITLALKTAELSCIARARRVQPILLLDDVSSELDGERTEALFAFLSKTDCQLFLTTTRRDLILSALGEVERREIEVESGAITRVT